MYEGSLPKMKNFNLNSTVRVSTDSSNNISTVNSNLNESKVEDREHVKIFEKIFTLFETYANLLGIQSSYHWVPHRNPMFLIVILMMIFTWFCIFYTQVIRIRDGDIMKVLEVCAVYGVATSV